MQQALVINIWQLSAILLRIPSPLKLFQVGWGQTHIFRFLQKYLIGFKSRLCHSRTFTALAISHSCCVFRSIVLLEGKPSAQSEVLNDPDWVFIKAISYTPSRGKVATWVREHSGVLKNKWSVFYWEQWFQLYNWDSSASGANKTK